MYRRLTVLVLGASMLLTGCDCGCVIGPAILSGAAAGVGGALVNEVVSNSK